MAVIYLLSPFDLIPGLHPVGWLDDIVVLFLLFRFLHRLKSGSPSGRSPFEDYRQQGPEAQAGPEAQSPPKTPYEILGVTPEASREEIKTAYRILVSQYHPDKVTHLGQEFQDLAEQRFKEIQDAYQKLSK